MFLSSSYLTAFFARFPVLFYPCEMELRNRHSGFAKAGLNSFDWTFVQGSTAVILLNFCAKIPPHRQAEAR